MKNSELSFINYCLNKRAYALQHLRNDAKDLLTSEMHFHDCIEFMLIVSGAVDFQVEDFQMPLSAGSLLLLQPNTFHRPICKNYQEVYDRYTLHIKEDYMNSFSTAKTNLEEVFSPSQIQWNKTLTTQQKALLTNRFRDAIKAIETPDTFGKDIIVNCVVSELLVMICRLYLEHNDTDEQLLANAYSKLTKGVIDYIDENISEKISLDKLAASMHVNKNYLSRLFKQESGISIYQFIMKRRIVFARDLLQDGICASDACYHSGFSDYSNFYRAFYNEYGLSPNEYCKSLQR